MKKIMFIFIAAIMILAFIAVAGCTKEVKIFVCANGHEVSEASACPTNKLAGVKKKDAEGYARNYVNAYFAARGGRAQLVSSYLDPDKGDYFATFVVSEKTGDPYETLVSVDGKTGRVNCTQSCEYI